MELLEKQRELEVEAKQAEEFALAKAKRLTICEEIEQSSGKESVDRVAELKASWDALPPMAEGYVDSLARRFQDACHRYEDLERRRLLAESAASRLETLASELEQLLSSAHTDAEILTRWHGLRADSDALREHQEANPVAAERLVLSIAKLEEREKNFKQLEVKSQEENLKRFHQSCRQLEALCVSERLTLKAGDRALKETEDILKQRLPLLSKKDRQEIISRVEVIRDKLSPRVQALQDTDDWKRWANLQVQESLCVEMERLSSCKDPKESSRKMRLLQNQWKEVAVAPRLQGQALWRRFKLAQDVAYGQCETYLSVQSAERKKNFVRKQELCNKTETLGESSNWIKTANAIKALQDEWKTIGSGPRGSERAIWERFRGSCDKFFTRRNEAQKHRKEEWATSLALKEALCQKAEELSEKTDWESNAATLKKLQAEWKTIGQVRKSKAEVVWKRFHNACEQFFERYKHRDQVDLGVRVAQRENVISELEGFCHDDFPFETSEILIVRVQKACRQWQQVPDLPRTIQQSLTARYQQALVSLMSKFPNAFDGTELDPALIINRMKKLIARLEKLISDQEEPEENLSPTELLAKQWRERLAANTISTGYKQKINVSKWRAIEKEVKNVQQKWDRLDPVPTALGAPFTGRFQHVCQQVISQCKQMS